MMMMWIMTHPVIHLPTYLPTYLHRDYKRPSSSSINRSGQPPSSSSSTTTCAYFFKELRSFSLMFWILSLCCLVVYGTILPFNNIASSLLQVCLYGRCVGRKVETVTRSTAQTYLPAYLDTYHLHSYLQTYPPTYLQERDYFKTPPADCALVDPSQCQSSSNLPNAACPESVWYQPPLPTTVDVCMYVCR